MALTVATNNGALMAGAAASSVNKDMDIAMERLSSGLRINSAADDAAGVAIASRLSSEIRGTNQAIRNAMDAQALIDTGEGSHKEIENILQRMRELAVQASNDTNGSTDRTNLNSEYAQLISEIDRIANVTTWAGQNLMNSTTTTGAQFTFQVGQAVTTNDRITVSILGMASTEIGASVSVASTTIAGSAGAARTAIGVLDAAIQDVNSQRAKLGAYSNRLDNTVNNLSSISTNLQAGKGRIVDADYAAETTQLSKTQILQQASTAMLAQANASKQNVLSLLQG